MKRLFAFFLCVALLLSGCGQKSPAAANSENVTEPPASDGPVLPNLPEQKTLSDRELTLACEQIDFALLGAAFYEDRLYYEANGEDDTWYKKFAYVGDADNNGHLEMVYSSAILMFKNTDGGKNAKFIVNQAGAPEEIYISNGADIYVRYSKEPIERMHGDHEHNLSQSQYYYKQAEKTEIAFVTASDVDYDACGVDLSFGFIDGEEVSWAEVQQYQKDLGLTEVNENLSVYITNTFDAAYYDCILNELNAYFSDFYKGYQGCFTSDIDNDGYAERIFVANEFVSTWLEDMENPYSMPLETIFNIVSINSVDNRTGFVIVDVENGDMNVQTACIPERITVTDNSVFMKNGNSLMVEGKNVSVHGWKEQSEIPAEFKMETAAEIIGIYENYCTFGVCELGDDFVETNYKKQILSAQGWSEDVISCYDLIEVPCCGTQRDAILHVQQYVALEMIPDRSDYADHPVEYNGKLYALIAGKGYESYSIAGAPIRIDDLHMKIELMPGIPEYYAPNDVAYFTWMDGAWKLTDIQQGTENIPVQDYTTLCNSIALHAESSGYKNIVIKHVDLGDSSTDELLCLCQRDDVWYLIIYIVVNGEPVQKNTVKLDGQACYLTEHDGSTYLLTYQQNVSGDGSNTYHSYSYELFRLNGDGNTVVVEEDSTGYYSSDTGAQNVATFFERLNKYLVKIIVIYDPFKLTGRTFMEQKEASFGQVPQEPEPEQSEPQPEPEKVQMGFVQIQDPNSWLNLREGPGLNYECVRMDPNDPGSIVRQALGSPVTVLEEVQSADGAWFKIRIIYQDREIVGYSYKAYIRLVNE